VISQLDQSKPRGSLRDRALAAGTWTLGSYGADLFVRLLSNLILTRLLFPEAFGAVAAAMALITGLVLISDFGVRTVVIQSPRSEEVGFLRSAWVFQLSHGSAVWIILVGLCALISILATRNLLPAASVFANPELPLITAVLGFSVVLGGAESTALPLNVRHLNYRPIVVLNLTSRLLSVPIMLVWAWIAPSVWAIVGGILAGSLIRTVLSHAWVPGPRMSLSWEKHHFAEILRFGRWMVVSSFASFISMQSDVILLGIFTPASSLGVYSIAKLLVSTGEGFLDQLNSALALPIFGEVLRKDPSNLRNRYYRFRLPIELGAGLLSGVLFTAGDFIVHFLYDARYAQAGFMLEILALGTMSYPFLIITNAFLAAGDTHIVALSSMLKATSLFSFVVIGFFTFGIWGAIGGIALHRLIPSAVIVFLGYRRNWIWIWNELRIVPAFIAGMLIGRGLVIIATKLDIHNIHQLFHS
jgi:O-antigen/teichoic acid export membrane protein